VFRRKVILATITLDLFAVLLGGVTALLPIFADQILHCGPVGWLDASDARGGAFSTALAVRIAADETSGNLALVRHRFRNCDHSVRLVQNILAIARLVVFPSVRSTA